MSDDHDWMILLSRRMKVKKPDDSTYPDETTGTGINYPINPEELEKREKRPITDELYKKEEKK